MRHASPGIALISILAVCLSLSVSHLFESGPYRLKTHTLPQQTGTIATASTARLETANTELRRKDLARGNHQCGRSRTILSADIQLAVRVTFEDRLHCVDLR